MTAVGIALLGTAPASASAGIPVWPAHTVVSAVPSDRAATVTWPAAGVDGGTPIASYQVSSSPGGKTCTVAAPALSCRVTGLTNGLGYHFSVIATNSDTPTPAVSVPSPSSPQTVPFGRPTAPTSVHATAGVQKVAASWFVGTGNGRPVTAYVVTLWQYGARKPLLTRTVKTTPRSITFTGLAAGSRYRIAVQTKTAAGLSTGLSSAYAIPLLPPAVTLPIYFGQRGPLVDQLQQRLGWVGLPVRATHVFDAATRTQVKHFQEKFLISQTGTVGTTTWAALVGATRSRGVLPAECQGRQTVVCISKGQRLLRYLVNGRLVLATDVRFGPESPPELATRNGVHYIFSKDRFHVSSQYKTNMYYAMFFDGGQAIHLSLYFLADGYYGHSHGCVNVRDETAVAYVYNHVSIGTKVYIYN